jgi:hypothetical protein
MIIPRLAEAIEYEGSVIEKLHKIVETYIDTIQQHPHMPTFMMMELAQSRADFVIEIKKTTQRFPNFQGLFLQIQREGQSGIIRQVNPFHLLLNTLALCVFPFIVKPIFTTVVGVPDQHFEKLMQERKEEVKSFIQHALRP